MKNFSNKLDMKRFLLILSGLFLVVPAFACTSAIISAKSPYAAARPVMFKHRDTDHIDNRMQWFQGERYVFVGLVNADAGPAPKEVWSGANSAGFCIMNTATYDLKDDDVPASRMDREGIVMFRALEICATVSDFEHLLDSLPRPMGVEANFGVIDAFGGAAYYEVNNHSWTKFDVNEEPGGYMVVTNFTRTGRPEDHRGVDRYERASVLMESLAKEADVQNGITHRELIGSISRSGAPILRDITSAVLVFEGVSAGSDPSHTVMWGCVGYPGTTAYVPMQVFSEGHLPSFVTAEAARNYHCYASDTGLQWKGKEEDPAMKACLAGTERFIESKFLRLFKRKEKMSAAAYTAAYDRLMKRYERLYRKNFDKYKKETAS